MGGGIEPAVSRKEGVLDAVEETWDAIWQADA